MGKDKRIIHCLGCGQKEFYIDIETLTRTSLIIIKCPECGEENQIFMDEMNDTIRIELV